MTWFLIALIAPVLWAVSNHLDKYLISRYFTKGGVGALMIFSAVIGFLLLPVIYFIEPAVLSLNPIFAAMQTLNGMMYVVAILPYFYALNKEDASMVAPLFQVMPIFGYFLALIFLGENLTITQMSASLLIIFGAVLISMKNDGKGKKFKSQVFWLMMLSSFFLSVNGLIFKYVAIHTDYWASSFWEYVGLSVCAILLFIFVKSYRRQFLNVFAYDKTAVLTLNGLNEVVNTGGQLVMSYATLLAPLALVWVVNGFQSLFVLIIGIFLAIFFPKLTDESLDKKYILQKVIAILVMFMGMYLLNR